MTPEQKKFLEILNQCYVAQAEPEKYKTGYLCQDSDFFSLKELDNCVLEKALIDQKIIKNSSELAELVQQVVNIAMQILEQSGVSTQDKVNIIRYLCDRNNLFDADFLFNTAGFFNILSQDLELFAIVADAIPFYVTAMVSHEDDLFPTNWLKSPILSTIFNCFSDESKLRLLSEFNLLGIIKENGKGRFMMELGGDYWNFFEALVLFVQKSQDQPELKESLKEAIIYAVVQRLEGYDIFYDEVNNQFNSNADLKINDNFVTGLGRFIFQAKQVFQNVAPMIFVCLEKLILDVLNEHLDLDCGVSYSEQRGKFVVNDERGLSLGEDDDDNQYKNLGHYIDFVNQKLGNLGLVPPQFVALAGAFKAGEFKAFKEVNSGEELSEEEPDSDHDEEMPDAPQYDESVDAKKDDVAPLTNSFSHLFFRGGQKPDDERFQHDFKKEGPSTP